MATLRFRAGWRLEQAYNARRAQREGDDVVVLVNFAMSLVATLSACRA
jgi:hypothetical protein